MTADGSASPDTVDCPYCAEPIKPQAIVCRHCRRDVGIPMPLLLAQRQQARDIEALRCELIEVRAELLAAQARGSAPAAQDGFTLQEAASQPGIAARPPLRPAWLLAGWTIGLLGLIGLHALLVFRLDASLAALRVACIGWPLLVGAALPGFGLLAPRTILLFSASLGLSAVAAMSGAIAHVDGTPFLPATGRDLYETLEFSLSITLAFAAGGLTRRAVLRAREREMHRKAMAQARGLLSSDGVRKVTDQAETLKKLIEAATPIVAIGGALIAGFRALFGGG